MVAARNEKAKKEKREKKPAAEEIRVKRPSFSDQPIDYKDAEFLRKFMTERGKIVPARFTRLSAKMQRELKRAIRRARVMGLVP